MKKNSTKSLAPKKKKATAKLSRVSTRLFNDIKSLIKEARRNVATAVNSQQVILYWHVGNRIRTVILKEKRATYGDEILSTLSKQLTVEYGRGFSVPNLSRMVKFAEYYSDETILSTLSKELSWSKLVEIIPITDPLKRDFYLEMCRVERWNVRTLRQKIQGMLFERTAISRKPEKLAEQELKTLREEDRMSLDMVIRDPYVLDFLDLRDTYSEKELEAAIIKELEYFLLELGTDFSFIARQKRMTIGAEDFYLDLLFYHRRLKRLVAIELKIGKFKAAFKGQMELYLKWLDKYERREGEDAPLGLILCFEKDHEQIKLLELWKNSIHVAEYMTELPPKKLLEEKLHKAIERARNQIEFQKEIK